MFILVRNRLRTDKHFMVKDRNYDIRREVEARIRALEKKVFKESKSKIKEWARCDSNAGSPPCKGDVITD